ncbi:proline-rich acidic protein 1 [Marmota marmota marmota]|uniref:proline-rich acidic protein 1 n=1 Tax=Marmota marmota marmota TaxID=9994 RepID=UPI002092F153|nr:proline-rich acidic protein 1 [Marmota marmota marmota]
MTADLCGSAPTSPALSPPQAPTHRPTRLFLVTCLVTVLLQEVLANPAPQVPIRTKGKHEQDVERAWGIQAVEPLKKDGQLVGLPPMPKLKLAASEEKHPGPKAWVQTEDILGRFRIPQQGPELDLDSLYHPPVEEVQGKERPWSPVLLPRQVLEGPEEDLDHIHHPMEDSREP